MPRHRWILLASSLAACSSTPAPVPAPVGALPPDKSVALPSGSSPGYDDLRHSVKLGKVISAVAGTGNVNLIDVASFEVTSLGGFGVDVFSADELGGLLYVVDRVSREVSVVDPLTKRVLTRAALGGSPDYVRCLDEPRELWISEPDMRQIEVLTIPPASPGTPVHAAFVTVESGPEGLALDRPRKRAYVHRSDANIVAIDLASRAVVGTWPTGCDRSHGIPAVDEARGFVFAGCGATKIVALDAKDNGKIVGNYALGGGTSILAYSAKLGHAYVRADPGFSVAVLGVSAAGDLSLLGTLKAGEEGHCMVADDRGGLWACDRPGGLLYFTDPFAATTASR